MYQQLKTYLQHNNIQLNNLQIDSRKIKKGDIFFCLKGENTDGHEYIEQALQSGAQLIIADTAHQNHLNHKEISFIEDTYDALAYAAATLNSKLKDLTLIGITGTNGKTSVAFYTAQLLSRLNAIQPIGVLGTNGRYVFKNGEITKDLGEGSGRTTPQAHDLHNDLLMLHQHECQTIIMEVSSHALAQKRVAYLPFTVAAFTNLTQDHLDYHHTMEQYFEAKAILFETLKEGQKAVINLNDLWSDHFLRKVGEKADIITYGIDNEKAELSGQNYQELPEGLEANIHYESSDVNSNKQSIQLKTTLKGKFNLSNILTATGIILSLGYDLSAIEPHLSKLKSTRGRFQIVEKPDPKLPTCIIDYAHTPDGLENILEAAVELKHSEGDLVCLFGCGGDRDPTKRPLMAKIAEKYSDKIIISNDNPRSEDPEQIVADIIAGLQNANKVKIELDRAKAIQETIAILSEHDLFVIAGKGHENYQILKEQTIHLDDYEEVKKAFSKQS